MINILDREAVLYRKLNDDLLSSTKLGIFDELESIHDEIKFSILKYNWIDPVRYKDKIVNRDSKSVLIVNLKSEPFLFMFGNSESNINYVESKITRHFSANIVRMDIFQKIVRLINENKFEYPLRNIQFKRNIDGYSKWISIDVNNQNAEKISSLLTNEEICILTFFDAQNNLHFYFDFNSSISFPDTAQMSQIVGVLIGVSKILHK